ncbi:MAG: type II toxin-antitoxin system Phd/YefM family antitoxin [Methanomicrobiales archaeon]|nr:type II toxin-antitoxin system Phd/YefM family antitoxin [Methanomicrobiales archaeon]
MQTSPQQYIVDENGKKISVVLPFSEYQKMQEDMHDLMIIAERKNEDTLSIAEIKKRLGRSV